MNTKPKIRPLLVVIISSALLACVPELMAARPSPPQIWSANQFYEVWNGYGSTSWSNTTLALLPKAPTEPSETHSALVVSKTSLKPPYRVQFNLTTVSQLRLNSPPYPCEVGWFVFGYKQDGKFKYILLKPNGYGIEFGESLLNDAQNYLVGPEKPLTLGGDIEHPGIFPGICGVPKQGAKEPASSRGSGSKRRRPAAG